VVGELRLQVAIEQVACLAREGADQQQCELEHQVRQDVAQARDRLHALADRVDDCVDDQLASPSLPGGKDRRNQCQSDACQGCAAACRPHQPERLGGVAQRLPELAHLVSHASGQR